MTVSDMARNAAVDAVATLLNGGTIDVMRGDYTRLATLKFSDPAFYSARGGVANSKDIQPDANAVNSGKPGLARLLTSGGKLILEIAVDAAEVKTGAAVSCEKIELRL